MAKSSELSDELKVDLAELLKKAARHYVLTI
jgi:hypothetical protein